MFGCVWRVWRAGVSSARLKSLDTSSRQAQNAGQWRPSDALNKAGPLASHRIGLSLVGRSDAAPGFAILLTGDRLGDAKPMPRGA